jgi:O-antigen/teichoic acid export membrane protein
VVRRRFLIDTLGMAASQYLTRGILLVRGLTAAASLGPHGYGGWNALNLILDYGQYAGLGTFQGLDLELPAATARGDFAAARRQMAGAWAAALTGGALFAALLIGYLAAGGRAFSAWPGWSLPLLMLAAVLMQLLFQYLASSLRALNRITAVSAGHALQAGLGGGLGILLVTSFGPWGLIVGWLAGTAIALFWMKRRAREAPLIPSHPREGMALARAGLPIILCFLASLIMRSVDRMALVHFGSPSALGLYSLGLLAAGLVLYLPEAAAFVLFPRMAAAAAGARDRGRLLADVMKAHRAVTLAIPLVAALGAIWAGPVITRLLPDYRDALPAIRLLAVGSMMLAAGTLPGYYLLAARRFRGLLAIGYLGSLVTAGLVFAVAQRAPAPGPVAGAAAIGYTLFATAVLGLASAEWVSGARARSWWMLLSLVPGLAAGGLLLSASRLGADGSWVVAAARSAVLVIGYAPIAIWLGRGVGLKRFLLEALRSRLSPASGG